MTLSRRSVLLIQTPEGIFFPLQLASPVTRMLAVLLDFVIVTSLLSMMMVLLFLIGIFSADLVNAAIWLVSFVILMGYPIFFEWFWRGQTPGKRALRLRVMDAQGLRLQFSQVVIRNLLRFVDSLPAFYFLGGMISFINRKSQRLGDIAANTIVVLIPVTREPDITQLLAGKYNSFREYPHLAARLRQNTQPIEAGIALQALVRRDALEPLARIRLFSSIASHMKRNVEFPVEVVEGLTDEQYVRNAVDILFSR